MDLYRQAFDGLRCIRISRQEHYSPDYNPIEKLWKKEGGTHLHYFPTFQDLKDKVHESLMHFANAAKKVLSLLGMCQQMIPLA